MMVVCNKRNKKFCVGEECEHYNPHERNAESLRVPCNCNACTEYHNVECIEYNNEKERR